MARQLKSRKKIFVGDKGIELSSIVSEEFTKELFGEEEISEEEQEVTELIGVVNNPIFMKPKNTSMIYVRRDSNQISGVANEATRGFVYFDYDSRFGENCSATRRVFTGIRGLQTLRSISNEYRQREAESLVQKSIQAIMENDGERTLSDLVVVDGVKPKRPAEILHEYIRKKVISLNGKPRVYFDGGLHLTHKINLDTLRMTTSRNVLSHYREKHPFVDSDASSNSTLNQIILNNVYNDLRVCWGDYGRYVNDASKQVKLSRDFQNTSFADYSSTVFSVFFGSMYNSDLTKSRRNSNQISRDILQAMILCDYSEFVTEEEAEILRAEIVTLSRTIIRHLESIDSIVTHDYLFLSSIYDVPFSTLSH